MRRLLTAVLPAAALVLAACSGTAAPVDVEGASVALVLTDASEGNSAQTLNAAVARVGELGMELEVFDAAGDDDRLADLVARAVEAGHDGVLVAPVHWNGLEGVSRKAEEAGVPLLLVGNQASVTGTVYVGPDPAEVGRVQLEGVAGLLGGAGDIAVVGVVNRTPFAYGFEDGYAEVLEANPGIAVVHSQSANGSPSQAADMVVGILARGADVVVAQGGPMAEGVRAALAEAGRADVAVAGVGTSDAALNALLDGAPGGTVWTDPAALGTAAVDTVADLVGGVRVADEVFVPGVEWVDASNVHEYLHE